MDISKDDIFPKTIGKMVRSNKFPSSKSNDMSEDSKIIYFSYTGIKYITTHPRMRYQFV